MNVEDARKLTEKPIGRSQEQIDTTIIQINSKIQSAAGRGEFEIEIDVGNRNEIAEHFVKAGFNVHKTMHMRQLFINWKRLTAKTGKEIGINNTNTHKKTSKKNF